MQFAPDAVATCMPCAIPELNADQVLQRSCSSDERGLTQRELPATIAEAIKTHGSAGASLRSGSIFNLEKKVERVAPGLRVVRAQGWPLPRGRLGRFLGDKIRRTIRRMAA